jgi:thioesterase domain-containing protein
MAQQLLAAGQTVGLLALIDAPVPSRSSRLDRAYRLVTRTGHHLRQLLRTPRGERMAYVRARLNSLTRRRKRGEIAAEGRPAEAALVEEYWGPIRSAYVRSLPDYAPAPYPGCIDIFLGRNTVMGRIRDPRLAWRRLAAGGVQVRVVPGDHTDMLREPNVSVLARELGRCLDRAAAGGGA